MSRFIPGLILAIFGVVVYVTGCLLYLAYRRQLPPSLAGKSVRPANDNAGPDTGSKTLLIYAIAMMVLGILALGAGLFALDIAQTHVPR
jgi:hypothetical protein